MNKNLIWAFALSTLAFVSCGDDDNADITKYKDGVVVVNQGAFGTGTGTLTFKERGSDVVNQGIYAAANENAALGNIAQSMIEHDGMNYIAINNGGKVVVTDDEDFTIIDTISGINQGRYFASNGDKLYLTSWGETGSNGGIYEINTSTNTVAEFIETGNGPEGLVFADDLLYVAKGGGFGLDSLLLIIDPSDNSIQKSIVVGDNPQLVVKDKDDNVFVICSGFSDWMNPANNTNGKLVKISNQEIEWSIDIPNGSNNLTIDTDNDFLYFVLNGEVVKQNLNNSMLQATVVRSLSAYALGFDQEDKLLYMSDAKDFSSQGQVYIYSTTEEVVDSFTAGVVPGYFHFQ